jgi:regulator of protease activity HflC (stomatin/prohibitin superfamily)
MNIAPLFSLDKLFDILKDAWNDFKPVLFINQYQSGVILRAGKYKRNLSPGWHLRIPFIDDYHIDIVTIDTMVTKAVHITTLDDKTITAVPIIEYTIDNIKKFLIDTNDARTNIHDITRAYVSDYLTDCTWEECKLKRTTNQLTKKIADQCISMGVTISRVMLSDLCVSRVIITQI